MSNRLLRTQDWERLAREVKYRPSAMAAHCRISLRHMQRFFAERFHETPRQWTTKLRCRLAMELITKGYSNKEVVAELGFADRAHFCHQFKKAYGFSPQTFAPRAAP